MTLVRAIALPQFPIRAEPGPSSAALPAASVLEDRFGRGVGYLRLSLTSACSMRCTYCRPETYDNPKNEQRLTPAEIESLVRHLVDRHGLTKVRLTGGDPTSRPELVEIIGRIAQVNGIDDLAMTTNGLTLQRMAKRYRDAGLKRINISLDTLDPQRFSQLTGVDGLERVLRGIEAARAAGLSPIKINTVVVRGQNDDELAGLVRFGARERLQVRFIELMPMGPLQATWRERYVPADEMRAGLSAKLMLGRPLPQGHDAARRYRVTSDDGLDTVVGFITPMSCNFCEDCNRLRLAADGRVYPCLMDKPAGSLLPALRPAVKADEIDRLLAQALTQKQMEHPDAGQAIMTTLGG